MPVLTIHGHRGTLLVWRGERLLFQVWESRVAWRKFVVFGFGRSSTVIPTSAMDVTADEVLRIFAAHLNTPAP